LPGLFAGARVEIVTLDRIDRVGRGRSGPDHACGQQDQTGDADADRSSGGVSNALDRLTQESVFIL
jgi:hypothetical protein